MVSQNLVLIRVLCQTAALQLNTPSVRAVVRASSDCNGKIYVFLITLLLSLGVIVKETKERLFRCYGLSRHPPPIVKREVGGCELDYSNYDID